MEKMEEKNMKTTELTDCFDNVTILFADIVNFTAFSNKVLPSQVFALLREVFTEFDKLSLKFHVYKLYTIGDCYVAISLVDKDNRNITEETNNIINLGFSMIEVINSVRMRDPAYNNFNMRIGIHNV
jgi:class 3 adenylate cyclase